MSASREKKQRQGAGPSEKAVQAQQEQAARKRKTIIYSAIGAVIAVLVVALLIWNSGFFQSRSTAATVGDTNLTAAEFSFFYYGTRNYYANYGSLLGYSYDASVDDDEQFADAANNITWRDQFLNEALSSAQQQVVLYQEALAGGHTAAEVKDTVDSSIASIKSAAASNGYSFISYLRLMYGPYMTASIYEKMTTQALLADLASEDKENELYNSYTQDDLRDYYGSENHADTLDTFEYSYLYFTPAAVETKDENGNELDEDKVNAQKEQALAEARVIADEALAEYKDGESVSHLIEHYAPSTSGDHITAVGTGTISSIYRDQLLELDKGEATVVENSTSGYYLVVYHDRYLVEEPTRDVRHILSLAETTTDESGNLVAPTDEAWAAAKEKIDAIKADWDAGSKTEDAFATLANQRSDDGNGDTGGLYDRRSPGSFVTEFNDWVFDDARQPGEVGLVQHEGDVSQSNSYWGYHLIYFVGENEPAWMGTVRSTLANEAQHEWQHELTEQQPAVLAGGASHLGK